MNLGMELLNKRRWILMEYNHTQISKNKQWKNMSSDLDLLFYCPNRRRWCLNLLMRIKFMTFDWNIEITLVCLIVISRNQPQINFYRFFSCLNMVCSFILERRNIHLDSFINNTRLITLIYLHIQLCSISFFTHICCMDI